MAGEETQEQQIYDTSTYRKHKRPDGWGSPCPEHDELDETPQELLDTGVLVDDAIFNVSGDYALRAIQHEPGRWHGHPFAWSRLPKAARIGLIECGRLDDATWRKALRKKWGQEFER